MGNSLTDKFGVAVTTAGMATFGAVLGVSALESDEVDLGNISDYIQQTVVSDIVHEPIENPYLNDFIDFNTDVDAFYGDVAALDSGGVEAIINGTAEGLDFTSGNFLSLTNMPQSQVPYAAFDKFKEAFTQNGEMVVQQADYVTADQMELLADANEFRSLNFLYITDAEQFRVSDKWTEGLTVDDVNPDRKNLRAGDCDDFSIWGVEDNNERGISVGAQTVVFMSTKSEEPTGHAMLMVRTVEGDKFYDMDNSVRDVASVAKDFNIHFALSLEDKGYMQKATVVPPGVEAKMDIPPEQMDVALPRPCQEPAAPPPTNSGMDI